MEVHRVSTYHDVEHALRITDLKQSLYDEGKILMDKVLVTLHGDEHRQRRSIESQLFRKNFFRVYENEVFPDLLRETLDQFLTDSSLDLKELGYRIMVHLSLSFAGIDRIDGTVEEADAQHRLLIQLGQAATIGQFKGDREPIFQEIREAIDEFRERFFLPSRARRLATLEDYQAGNISEEALPRDILTILLMHDAELSMPDELMVREVAFFYLAASHTSVHTLVHATHELFNWCANENKTPEEIVANPHQLQRFVLESMRLHPSSPEAWRRAEADVTLADGRLIPKGDKVVVELQTANRDATIFGDDATEFNPQRAIQGRISPAGMSFGGGMHVCLGMNLVAGTVLRDGEAPNPENHQFGTVTLIIKELIERGMLPNPDQLPQKIEASERDVWATYPVLF
ncbi:MAG: cytochrome P450 [Halieaceae bacterium]|jgi:cytochrome P450|nr:MAG: cytochrome P450 [Halieaceae bacterium]